MPEWRTRRNGAQTTLANRATLSGVGVHSGHAASVTLHPAEADSGIYFYRTNLDDGRDREIPADFRHVSATDLCTTVGVSGASVATIEHLMATLRALEIDNCMVEIDGPEVPVMDGSAEAFIDAIDKVGDRDALEAPRRYIKVKKPVRVELGNSFAEFRPHDGRRIEVEIDFANPLVGRQRYAADIDRRHASAAISPGPAPSASLPTSKKLWARGFALGASLDNADRHRRGPRHQSGGPALHRRVRPPQGARRGRRPRPRRRADPRLLPLVPRRPQAQRDGASRRCSPTATPGAWSRCRSAARAAMPIFRPASASPAFGPEVS